MKYLCNQRLHRNEILQIREKRANLWPMPMLQVRQHKLVANATGNKNRDLFLSIYLPLIYLLSLSLIIAMNEKTYRTWFRSFTRLFVVSESPWQRNLFFCMKSSPLAASL